MTVADGDLLCIQCGYNLRGLPAAGACPECGVPIERSRTGDRLADANADWLRGLVRGLRLIMWGLTCLVATPILLVLGYLVLLNLDNMPHYVERTLYAAGWVLVFALLVVCPILVAIGTLMVTAQEPREQERESITSNRRVARWGMIAIVAVGSGILLGELLVVRMKFPVMHIALRVAAFLVFTVALVALLRWLASLMRRVPDEPLAKSVQGSAKFFTWALPVVALVHSLGLSSRAIPGPTVFSFILALGGCAITIIMFSIVIQGVIALGLMSSCLRALKAMLRDHSLRLAIDDYKKSVRDDSLR